MALFALWGWRSRCRSPSAAHRCSPSRRSSASSRAGCSPFSVQFWSAMSFLIPALSVRFSTTEHIGCPVESFWICPVMQGGVMSCAELGGDGRHRARVARVADRRQNAVLEGVHELRDADARIAEAAVRRVHRRRRVDAVPALRAAGVLDLGPELAGLGVLAARLGHPGDCVGRRRRGDGGDQDLVVRIRLQGLDVADELGDRRRAARAGLVVLAVGQIERRRPRRSSARPRGRERRQIDRVAVRRILAEVRAMTVRRCSDSWRSVRRGFAMFC